MFPKISRFVTIAALTTLTCVLNPPSDARASDVELMAQSRYNSPEVVEPEVTLTFPELVEKTFIITVEISLKSPLSVDFSILC